MYNIPAGTTSLPQNAGTTDSVYGVQIFNDFFQAPNYGGPCPPMTATPLSHKYQFTVYALDRFLVVPTFGDFTPAGPEGLYQALIDASRNGHVLASASIAGFYAAADH